MMRLHATWVMAALASMAVTVGAQAQPFGGDAAAGKADWSRVGCYACHGFAAQGLESTGPQLSGRTWAFPVFNAMVRHPANTMPPFTAKVLSDGEVRNLMAYVNSVPVKRPIGGSPKSR